MRNLSALISLLIIVIVPLRGISQAWLGNRSAGEGPGVKISDSLVLHPGLGIEGGYDTNPLLRPVNVVGAGRLKITPYLDLATSPVRRLIQDEGSPEVARPKVDFRLGLAGYYSWYFSEEQAVKEQNHLGLDSHMSLSLFPQGNFNLFANVTYLRTLQPYETSADAWAHHSIGPGVGVRIIPGGGTLSFEPGYRLNLMVFEDDDLAAQNNKMTHNLSLLTAWKMLPKTALVSNIRFSPVSYLGDSSINNDSLPVRSLFGVRGLFTEKFGLSLLAGYGASFYERGENFDGFIANGEMFLFITPFSKIRIGGQRDFVDSFYSNFFIKTGGYAEYMQMLGGIFLITAKSEVFYRDYAEMSGQLPNGGALPLDDDRRDVWIKIALLLELRATSWLAFHVSGQYQGDLTEFEYEWTRENSITPAEYHRFEVMGGVRVHY